VPQNADHRFRDDHRTRWYGFASMHLSQAARDALDKLRAVLAKEVGANYAPGLGVGNDAALSARDLGVT
jgi:hypothetical protein